MHHIDESNLVSKKYKQRPCHIRWNFRTSPVQTKTSDAALTPSSMAAGSQDLTPSKASKRKRLGGHQLRQFNATCLRCVSGNAHIPIAITCRIVDGLHNLCSYFVRIRPICNIWSGCVMNWVTYKKLVKAFLERNALGIR